jgi:hypothetical protein
MPTKTRIAKLTELIFDKQSSTEYHPIDFIITTYSGLLEGNK